MKQLMLDIFRTERSVMIKLNPENIVRNEYVIITSE